MSKSLKSKVANLNGNGKKKSVDVKVMGQVLQVAENSRLLKKKREKPLPMLRANQQNGGNRGEQHWQRPIEYLMDERKGWIYANNLSFYKDQTVFDVSKLDPEHVFTGRDGQIYVCVPYSGRPLAEGERMKKRWGKLCYQNFAVPSEPHMAYDARYDEGSAHYDADTVRQQDAFFRLDEYSEPADISKDIGEFLEHEPHEEVREMAEAEEMAV